jgi:Spy/CpxP family protein refolding chaperone
MALSCAPVLAQTKTELKGAAQGKKKVSVADKTLTKTLDRKINSAGTWWRNPAHVESLGLTVDQQKKMDDVFQEFRLKLIDLNANLQKEETILEPLMEAERMDEARILAQVDRVALARAELEKSNARMLLGIRQAMTADQWGRLQVGKVKSKGALKPSKN